jgi:sulfatase modifying factor 1
VTHFAHTNHPTFHCADSERGKADCPWGATRSGGSLIIGLLLFLVSPACALELEWVTVGDAGNLPDRTGYGAVAYEFQICKYEITVGQYVEFLNAVAFGSAHGLENAGANKKMRTGTMGNFVYEAPTGSEQRPMAEVGFMDAMRFANWMHNGCGKADTEHGAYDIPRLGGLAVREAGAKVWIPSEDEWYKAAYFQPEAKGGPPGGYWLYPTRSNQTPAFNEVANEAPNQANYFPMNLTKWDGTIPRKGEDVLPVGSFSNSGSYYGTYDQGGNVWEWNEAIVFGTNRGLRGGSVLNTFEKMRSWVRTHVWPEGPNHRFTHQATGLRLARPLPAFTTPSAPAGGTPKKP